MHYSLIRTIGAASTVLLKNTNGALPLKAPKSLAIIGNDAADNPNGPNSFSDRGGDVGILALGWGSGTADFPYLIAVSIPSYCLGILRHLEGFDVCSLWMLSLLVHKRMVPPLQARSATPILLVLQMLRRASLRPSSSLTPTVGT